MSALRWSKDALLAEERVPNTIPPVGVREGLVVAILFRPERRFTVGISRERGNLPPAIYERTLFFLTIIMSNERSSDHARIRKVAGSFKEKLFSLLHLTRAPAPSSIDMDSSSDNRTK